MKIAKSGRLNWRGGFIRLWALSSALFVIGLAAIDYPVLRKSYNTILAQHEGKDPTLWGAERLVPQLCGNARGVAGQDFSSESLTKSSIVDPYENCWYAISKFRPLYPELRNLSDKELSAKLYDELLSDAPWADPAPWTSLAIWCGFAVGIPLGVLVFGFAIAWVISGFAYTKPL